MSLPPTHQQQAEWDTRVRAMLPIVHHIVRDVASRIPRFVDRDDLMSAGLLGLAQAAKSFDPGRGVGFNAYARARIKGAVLDELRSRDWLSRGTRALANRVNAAAAELQAQSGAQPSVGAIAGRLGIDEADVRRVRDDVARAAGLERPSTNVGEPDVAYDIPAIEAGPLSQLLDRELRGYLIDAVCALPERLRFVVVAHFLDEREMQEIAVEMGVTAPRVSQLCAEGIALLRDGINAQLDPELVDDLEIKTGRVGRRKSAYYATVSNASTMRGRLERTGHEVHGVTTAAA
jgi:RNA polymerase sigma factor for flagellar operon FliA